jgi:hypothetical protein
MQPVIVIHGTFANEATWWRPGGSFCQLLDSHLKQEGSEAKCWDSIPAAEAISEFGWSGLNSEASRSHAAELLSKKIESLSRKPFIEKIHFVAHSHGGNVLLKSFLLCRREIDNRKFGSFVFLGTPFFEYSSLTPTGAFWQSVRNITEKQFVKNVIENARLAEGGHGERLFVIQSKYDEAYQLLSKAVHLRNSAYAYSRKLAQKSTSGTPLPPTSLSPLTLLKLRLGRFGIVTIRAKVDSVQQRAKMASLLEEGLVKMPGTKVRASRQEEGQIVVSTHGQGPPMKFYIGRLDTLRLAPGIAARFLMQFLLSICAPFISLARRWGQRWGTYFGIKAMMSTALGDDLAFERVLSVKQTTDVAPAMRIELDGRVEETILSCAVSGTDETLVRLYRSMSMVPSELELESLAESISEVFKAKQIVHSQYYQNGSVVEIVARAIGGSLHS